MLPTASPIHSEASIIMILEFNSIKKKVDRGCLNIKSAWIKMLTDGQASEDEKNFQQGQETS